MSGLMDEWMMGQITGYKNCSLNNRMDAWIVDCLDEFLVDKSSDGWMARWMDGLMYNSIFLSPL